MLIFKKPEHLWPALWAGAIVILVAIIALEHFFGRSAADGDARIPAKIVEAKLLPEFSLPSESILAPETAARPLFVPSRRLAPPVAAAAVSEMKRGQFALTGVTVTPEASFAFLKEVATGKTRSVKKGEQVNGLTLDAVEPRQIVLKQGEEAEILTLNIGKPPPMPTAPVSMAGVHRTQAPAAAGAPPSGGKDASTAGSGAPPPPAPGLTIPGWPAAPVNPSATSEALRRQPAVRHLQQ